MTELAFFVQDYYGIPMNRVVRILSDPEKAELFAKMRENIENPPETAEGKTLLSRVFKTIA